MVQKVPEVVSLRLEPADDLAGQISLYAIGLNHDESDLGSHGGENVTDLKLSEEASDK